MKGERTRQADRGSRLEVVDEPQRLFEGLAVQLRGTGAGELEHHARPLLGVIDQADGLERPFEGELAFTLGQVRKRDHPLASLFDVDARTKAIAIALAST